MAETATTTNTTTGSTRKPAARKSTARKSTARKTTARKSTARKSTARKTTTTRRSTATKSPSTSTGRRARTIARNETRDAAQAQVRAARTTAAQGRNVAERAALVYVGATLEARDRVLDLAGELADRFGTRPSAEREVRKDIRRFERRGTTARNQIERDVKKARTRVERLVRTRRRDAERLVRTNGNRVASVAKERVSAIV